MNTDAMRRASVCRTVGAAALAVGLAILGATTSAERPQQKSASTSRKASIAKSSIGQALSADSRIVVASLAGAAARIQSDDWAPNVNRERERGGTDVYAAVAPAVAVVRTPSGHGSGFFVSADGLLVTNHHVIAPGLNHTAAGSFAVAYTGKLADDGLMVLDKGSRRAFFLKSDPTRDLALLKLEGGVKAAPVPFLKLADRGPRPGLECAIIGHPASGMLWTYRPGQVSAVGDNTRDMVDVLVALLSANADQRAQIERALQGEPVRRIFLSSAAANPGDSGGPVIDQQGRVLGVTFAGPGDVGLRSFTYHIHLDELREFLKDVPASPTLRVPDPWEAGTKWAFAQAITSGTGRPDVLVSGEQGPAGDQPAVFYMDLDGDSPGPFTGDPAMERLVRRRGWDFEFAIDIRGTGFVTYYDTDNDSRVDLILSTDDEQPYAKERMSMDAQGRWRWENVSGKRLALLSPTYFRDQNLQVRMKLLRSKIQEWPWPDTAAR